jgi:hypothetical protein
MGGTCSTNVEYEKCIQNGNWETRDELIDLVVDGSIILKIDLRQMGCAGLD